MRLVFTERAQANLLFYEVDDVELTVLRVLHHARDVKLASF